MQILRSDVALEDVLEVRGHAELDLEDGNGLKNMHSRMEAINGRLEILSHPGQGTKVYLRLLHNRVIGVQGKI
jgi:signal transduction histidine kinase